MKKINRIFKFIIIAVILMNFISIYTYNVQALTYDQMISQSESFISTGKGKVDAGVIESVTKEFVPLGQILTMIGAGVMVAVTTYMGIKYLTSGPDAQAKLKQQLIGLVVAGVVIFGAYGIWATVLRIADSL